MKEEKSILFDEFAELYNNAPCGYHSISPDGTFLRINDTALKWLGYSREELIGKKKLTDLFTQTSQAIFQKHFSLLKEKGEANELEIDYVRKEGAILPALLKTIAIRDKAGNFMKGRSALFDITERKQAEEKYKTIVNTTLDGFWITDLEGRFLEVNNVYCCLIGYSREELLKMKIKDVEALENPAETVQRIQRIITNGAERFESQHRCRDGKIIDIEISVNYLNIEGGQLFVFLRDITESKRAAEELKKANIELEEFYNIAIGRELKMKQLQEELDYLRVKDRAMLETMPKIQPETKNNATVINGEAKKSEELEKMNKDLEEFYDIAIAREMKLRKMAEELEELRRKLGR